jgi:cytochrome P450 family 6
MLVINREYSFKKNANHQKNVPNFSQGKIGQRCTIEMSATLNLIALSLIVVFVWIYSVFRRNFQLWKTLNVPHLEPTFPYGNVLEILKSNLHFAYIMENLYKDLKALTNIGYGGIHFFKDPVLIVTDPEFAKTIMVKDFNCFVDRGVYSNGKVDPLSANLFFLEGQKWRDLRAKLTPTFTSGKLKMMFHTILAVGQELDKHLLPMADKCLDVDIRDILGCFMTDIIGSCAFGIDCNSLENPNSKFRVMGKQMINFPKPQALKIFFAMMFRETARKLNVRFNSREVSDFFMDVVRETIDYRERTKERRKDFMQLLLDLKDDPTMSPSDRLSFEEIAAQAFVFFFAGFETSATTMTYALHLLAQNPEIQARGREEVKRTLEKYDGQFTYDGVMEMTMIENIIKG